MDTSSHRSGYVGVRGQRVYADTFRSKEIFFFKKSDNSKDWDDSDGLGRQVVFMDSKKQSHGTIIVPSADYKPGHCIMETDWGQFQEVSLKSIKCLYSQATPYLGSKYNSDTKEREPILTGSAYSSISSEADKKKFIDQVKKDGNLTWSEFYNKNLK